jgi:hypothetical protein
MFYLTIFIPLSVSGKLTGTLSGIITCVKPASFGLLCAWREELILRQKWYRVVWSTVKIIGPFGLNSPCFIHSPFNIFLFLFLFIAPL